MSTVQAFFKQRQKDQLSGKSAAETIAALRGEGSQPAFQYAHVAVQGCCHGELTRIYDACAAHEAETGKKIDFLICCGDFQSIRNGRDLSSMAVPDKYKVLGDFSQYFSADDSRRPSKVAPYLTIFVGGNHENSDWLAEESYGGFLAPNIYYLGHSGVVEVELPVSSTAGEGKKPPTGVVVVGGLSGIFKGNDYDRPYPPRPYAQSENGKRSAYHIRRIEQEKLEAFVATVARERHAGGNRTTATATSSTQPMTAPLVDIFVSHDWPVGITKFGDEEQLLRYKPFFKDDIAHHALGNPHTLSFLKAARPRHWIAAHLHCFFTAQVPVTIPPAQLASSEDGVTNPVAAVGGAHGTTSFVALDKCAKGKGFLDFIDVPIHWSESQTSLQAVPSKEQLPRLRRHPAWVDILCLSHPFLAQNAVGHNGFTAAAAVDALRRDTVSSPPSPEALYAKNTAALLSALHLRPALPLQGTCADRGAARDPPSQPFKGEVAADPGPLFRPPWRTHGLRHTQQPPTVNQSPPNSSPPSQCVHSAPNAAKTNVSAPTAAPSPAMAKDAFEDVGDSPWVVDLGPGSS